MCTKHSVKVCALFPLSGSASNRPACRKTPMAFNLIRVVTKRVFNPSSALESVELREALGQCGVQQTV